MEDHRIGTLVTLMDEVGQELSRAVLSYSTLRSLAKSLREQTTEHSRICDRYVLLETEALEYLEVMETLLAKAGGPSDS